MTIYMEACNSYLSKSGTIITHIHVDVVMGLQSVQSILVDPRVNEEVSSLVFGIIFHLRNTLHSFLVLYSFTIWSFSFHGQ